MSTEVSSKRYAQAIFQIAKERNEMDIWLKDVWKIAGLMQNEQLILVMENPKVHFEQKSKLLTDLLGKINPLALNFAYLLVLKNRFKYASQIAEQYEYLLDEYNGLVRANVITSIAIDDNEKDRLSKELEKMIRNKLKIKFSVDEKIIGGFIARFNGSMMDGSIKHRLEILKKNISLATR